MLVWQIFQERWCENIQKESGVWLEHYHLYMNHALR
jgi:hypothetical protein